MPLIKRKKKTDAGLASAAKVARKRTTSKNSADTVREAEEATLNSDDELSSNEAPPDSDGDELHETADEARIRIAKEYLQKLSTDAPEKEDVQEQLKKDLQQETRKPRAFLEDVQLGEAKRYGRAHRFAVTCLSMSEDETTVYTGGKDCHVVRWDLETGSRDTWFGRPNVFDCGGHFQKVLACCLVERRSLLFTGGEDRLIRSWDPRGPTGSVCKSGWLGHAAAVTGIAVDPDGTHLYTASLDKSLRIWDLRTKKCIDTLFGHTGGVTCLDLYNQSRPLTGGADKTGRFWKIDRETHLVFNRNSASVDAVTVADHDRFLTGGEDGVVNLWSPTSKRPLTSLALGSNKWVTALKAVRSGNVVFGATVDCHLHCWRFGKNEENSDDKNMQLTEVLPPVKTPGIVNAIAVGKKVVACGFGSEHRLGRWHYDKKLKSGLMVYPLSYREA